MVTGVLPPLSAIVGKASLLGSCKFAENARVATLPAARRARWATCGGRCMVSTRERRAPH